MMLLRSLLLSLALGVGFPVATLAMPVTIDVYTVPDFDTGHFGGADACTDLFGCDAGGVLFADLDGSVLSNLHGDILVSGVGAMSVTDGTFDFSGVDDSWFVTSELGGFDIAAMSLEGSDLRFLAESQHSHCGDFYCKRVLLRFGGHLGDGGAGDGGPSLPEPSAALLFGLGAVAVSRRVSRR
jgi:hypothetical protein